MECRPHCGACCTAPSISSPIPGMPNGKMSGIVRPLNMAGLAGICPATNTANTSVQ